MTNKTFLDDKITFYETEIQNVLDVNSVKHSHIGSILVDSQTGKYVFVSKVKADGTPMFYKAWYLAKILTKLNELNKQFTEVYK